MAANTRRIQYEIKSPYQLEVTGFSITSRDFVGTLKLGKCLTRS